MSSHSAIDTLNLGGYGGLLLLTVLLKLDGLLLHALCQMLLIAAFLINLWKKVITIVPIFGGGQPN